MPTPVGAPRESATIPQRPATGCFLSGRHAMDSNHPSTKRLVDLLRSFGLELLVKAPTRLTATTQSAIDNIITNVENITVSVDNTAISDHYGQEAIVSEKEIVREPKITKTIRDTRPENIALLNTSLSKESVFF
ncbi:hypothetical protein J6590_009670 [Homalodisca vitripennis]|nr:hypothetical protein J6590_009670 [Homalodisca vitripennis]